MAGGQWEVVGAKKKANKAKNGVNNKLPNDKKNNQNSTTNFQKFGTAGLIKEHRTIFDAFIEKEKSMIINVKNKSQVKEVAKPKTKESVPKPKKKKTEKGNSPKPINMDTAISSISDTDLGYVLTTVQARFPGAPMIWLKDMVSFMNIKLDRPTDDVLFSSRPVGYPCSLLDKNIYGQMVTVIKRCPNQIQHQFFASILDSVIQDTLKGVHTLGSRLVLQCVAQEFPAIVIACLSKCLALYNSNKNPNVQNSILWIAGQAGNKNFDAGFQVWNRLMFPILGSKYTGTYIVDYLENLLSSTGTCAIKKSVIGVKEFFTLFDFIFSKDTARTSRNRFQRLVPKLKQLSYGPEPTACLRNFFPNYLRRLEPEGPEALQKEVLRSLIECLKGDTFCYSIWKQLFAKHTAQSKLLITYLSDNWEKLQFKHPKKYLSDTLKAFQATSDNLIKKGKSKSDAKDCLLVSKKLLGKMDDRRFSRAKIVCLSLVLLLSLLAYDLAAHGSFEKSTTGRFVKDAGLLPVYKQAAKKIGFYYDKTSRWLAVNMPTLTAWVKKTGGPYLELFWKNVLDMCVFLWNSTMPLRVWCNENIPPLLNVLTAKLSAVCNEFLVAIAHYGNAAVTWLHTNVFVGNLALENIQKQVGTVLETLQLQVLNLQEYISSHVSDFVDKGK